MLRLDNHRGRALNIVLSWSRVRANPLLGLPSHRGRVLCLTKRRFQLLVLARTWHLLNDFRYSISLSQCDSLIL